MSCLVCGSDTVTEQLNVGSHPVATFFLDTVDAPERNVPLPLGQCQICGTVQLTQPVPHTELIPPTFISAREPEEHLDTVVEQILALPGVTSDSVIGALTYKDDTTLDRFRAKGFNKTWRVQLGDDLAIKDPNANIETIQKLTVPERMRNIAARYGQADIFVVRHIAEHAEDPQAFVRGIAELVKPGGIVMLEVPDSMASLRLKDYCMVWEEHSLYLTPATFGQLSSLGGFEQIRLDIYPLPFENSLVQLARKTGEPQPLRVDPVAKAEVGLLDDYAAAFEPSKRELRTTLEKIRAESGPIALFGAGHLACAFANYMDVADLIDFVADDTPEKQGRFLPGARLPIVPSGALVERGTALCLLALSINNEEKVIARNQAFVNQGGIFKSIFRASPRSIFASVK
ncbi:methyltransferase domain-containing protein [Rhodospirillum sp. A1_3_36]|uniref:methyltransferase domain-containing protein n=1 Tax=Rhodospirillum sp. A1_3_36 TaxID=3391666 RepID=UPI0039A63D68